MPISLSGSLNLSGSLTTTGTITATTLVVQTITSSVSSITGSTNFGSLSSNTHTFTGSMSVSGSAAFVGTMTATKGVFGTSGTGTFGVHITDNDQSNVRLRLTNTGTGGQAFSIVGGNPGASNSGLAIYDETNAATRMYISSSGNIGIGTTTPSYTLDVSGGGRFSSGATAQNVIIQSTNGESNATTLQISNSSNSAFNDGVKMIQGGGVFKMQDLTGSILLALDLTNTKVGIGTTGPVARLNVFGTSGNPSMTADTNNLFSITGNLGPQLNIGGYNGASYGMWLQVKNADNSNINYPILLQPLGGAVGIGTTSPLSTLQVGNGTQSGINGASNKIHIATTGTRSALLTLANSSGAVTVEGQFESSAESADLRVIIGSTTNHDVVLRTNNAEKLRITTSGILQFSTIPTNNYQIDSSTLVTVASGATLNFPVFSGMIVINNTSNGHIGIYLCGAGSTSLIAAVVNSSGLGSLAYNSGINGYTWTSNATASYGIFVVRTRANA